MDTTLNRPTHLICDYCGDAYWPGHESGHAEVTGHHPDPRHHYPDRDTAIDTEFDLRALDVERLDREFLARRALSDEDHGWALMSPTRPWAC